MTNFQDKGWEKLVEDEVLRCRYMIYGSCHDIFIGLKGDLSFPHIYLFGRDAKALSCQTITKLVKLPLEIPLQPLRKAYVMWVCKSGDTRDYGLGLE